jgi:hypothetical protein
MFKMSIFYFNKLQKNETTHAYNLRNKKEKIHSLKTVNCVKNGG